MKVLALEGMRINPFRPNQFLAPLLNMIADKANSTWLEWNNNIPDLHYDLIISHSLGGHRALQIAPLLKPKHLITIDPRPMTNWGFIGAIPLLAYLQRNPGFTAPNSVKCFNFYQRGPWMPGYAVSGAENKLVFDTHLTIPGNAAVRSLLRSLAGV